MADKIIIEVGLDNGEYAKRAEDTIKKIQALKDQQALLTAQGKKDTVQFEQNKLKLQELGRELKANTTLSQNYEDSIVGLRAKLSVLTLQWSQLSKEQRENSAEGRALSAQMADTTNKLKEQEGQVGNNTRNVGNYKQSVKDAISELVPFGGQVLQAANGAKVMAGNISTGSSTLGVFKTALAATGIGLIIPLIAALINYLKGFDPLIDTIEQFTAGAKAGFEALGRVVTNFITNIKSVGDLLNKLGNIIAHPIDSFKSLGKEMATAAKQAASLKAAQQDLTDAMIAQDVQNAKAEQQIAQLMLQAKNRSLSEKERTKLLQEAARIDEDNYKKRASLINQDNELAIKSAAIRGNLSQKEIQRLRNEGTIYAIELQNQGKLTEENVDAIKKSELSRIEILKESTNRQEKIQNQQDALAEKAAAKAEKLAKARQERLEKAKEADEERVASLVRTNQTILTERQKELNSINAEINEKVEKYKKYGRTTEQLEKERNARLKEVRERFHEEDLKAIEDNNRQIQDILVSSIKDNTERELAQITLSGQRRLSEQDKVINELKNKVSEGEKGLTDIIASEELLRQTIIEDNARIKTEKISAAGDEELKKAQELQLALAQLAVDSAGNPSEQAVALQAQLDQEYEIRIANALRLNEDTYLIHQEFANKQKELDADMIQYATDQFNAFGDSFQQVVGKNAFAAKVAADLQMKANAGIALQNNILIIQEQVRALASQGKLPFPANLVAIASTLAALGGAISSAKTLFTLPKFQDGGLFESDGRGAVLPGYSRTDNTNAKLRSGEAVIVAEAARDPEALGMLSAINVRYGGRPLVGPGSSGYRSSTYPHLASGGIYGSITGASISQSVINPNEIAAAIASEFSKLPAPIVNVRDITTVQQKTVKTENNSLF